MTLGAREGLRGGRLPSASIPGQGTRSAEANIEPVELEIDRYCFVCGPENPAGLHATFVTEDGRATGRYLPVEEHRGYVGISHGGVLAALLDEAMIYAAATLGKWATTAELTVRYHRPAPTGRPLIVRAEITEQRRRILHCAASIVDEEETLIASGTGRLMQGRDIRGGELGKLPDGGAALAQGSGEEDASEG
jgi:uncharacterized protein (TIGR00369 family)